MVVNLGGKAEPSLSQKWQGRENAIANPERSKTISKTSEQKVPVIYYLSRNGQLEHPHFMEVPLSSPQGLCLKGKRDCLQNKTKTEFKFFFHQKLCA